jgi:hypothetical protein
MPDVGLLAEAHVKELHFMPHLRAACGLSFILG